MSKQKYNLAVIGAGSGGLVCAAGASGLGARVLLIEKHKMGGDCLHTGCVPSKALIRSAKIASYCRRAADFGIRVDGVSVDFQAVMERVRRIIARIQPHDSPERFRGLGVNVRLGAGAFVSDDTVTDGCETFRARRVVIATGSRPAIPPLPGLETARVLTSENVWELRDLPRRLVVIGGGPVGCELAQCFARFGSEVTIVMRDERLLPRDDEEAADHLAEAFRAEGITVLTGAEAEAVVESGSGKALRVRAQPQDGGRKELPFDALLIAAGRRPNTEGLALEKAGVAATEKGIVVGPTLQTSVPHIYACGDVAGPLLFTHTADYQARLILRNALFPGSRKADYRVVPWCTYTDPEVAQVGLTPAEASRRGLPHDVTVYRLKDLDRAICDGSDRGFVKIVTERKSDRILGATIVGEHAGDLLQELVLAMRNGVGLKRIASTIHSYPTLAEGSKRTADAWMRGLLTPRTKHWLEKYFAWQRGR